MKYQERPCLSLISIDFGGGVWWQQRVEVDLTLFSPSLVNRGDNSNRKVEYVDTIPAIEVEYYSVIHR
ncbi:MAG: hypothetical protein V3T06_03845 [Dehalococcoidia bacterium]